MGEGGARHRSGDVQRGDDRRRVEGETAGEEGQPPEQRALVGREQVVAPGQRRPQRALPLGDVLGAGGEPRQAALGEASVQGGRR
jgi:hypothetical protein